jgi:glycosyltransferase involved in cell wall biosynthesis
MSGPAVDVIIAARDEARSVGACVASLRHQAYAGPLRVCVVDDASRDDTATRAAACGADILCAPRRGRAAARNAGLRATGGELVAFLDAHVVVDPNWVERMAQRFVDPRLGGCQSMIDQRAASPRAARFLERTAALADYHVLADSVRGERNLFPWLSTASCMYRRAALESVGGFDERMVACEDVELSWRVVTRGYRLGYVAETCAAHYDTRSWLAFVTKGCAYGRGAAQIESLYRLHGARTTFQRIRMGHRHPEAVLGSLSYVVGFRLQQLGIRVGLAARPEPIPLHPVDAVFRPWFFWTAHEQLRISPWVVYWMHEGAPVSVLVQPSVRRRFVLEGTGDCVWRLLAGEYSRDDIAYRISTAYGIAPETAAQDLDTLIAELCDTDVIERHAAAGEERAR